MAGCYAADCELHHFSVNEQMADKDWRATDVFTLRRTEKASG